MVSLGRLHRSVRGIRPYLLPYSGECFVGVLGMLMSVFLLLPVPLLTKHLVDDVIPLGDVSGVVTICLLSGAILIASSISGYFQKYYLGKFELDVFKDIQLSLVRKLRSVDPAYRHTQQTGYLLSRVTDDTGRLRSLFTDVLANLVKDVLILVVGIILLYYLDWRLASIALITLPFFIATWYYFNSKIRLAAVRWYEQSAQYTKKLEETIGLLDTVVALHASAFDMNKLCKQQGKVVEAGVKKNGVEGIARVVISIIGGLSPILIIGFGSHFIFQGTFSLGGLIAFNTLTGYVFGPSSRMVNSLLSMQQGVAAWERVEEILRLPECIRMSDAKSEHLVGYEGAISIELRNVTVRYGVRDAINDVSITVPGGSFVALVGESGSGKSTIMRTVLGIQAATAGSVLFNGLPMHRGEQLSTFRIAVLSQEPNLFATTIRENILLGLDDYDVMVQAARDAQIESFIGTLPRGYDTRIDERGINLSVGQKQRIALARCLVMNPNLLLLDEPTSNLDIESERQLWDALRPIMRKRTTIMAAHRLHTISEADCIYVLSKGSVVEQGTHSALLKLCGQYSRLWNMYR